MTLISGFRKALMTPKIAATATSVPIFDQSLPASSSMPGTTAVATARAAAETTTRSKNLMRPDITRLGDRFARLTYPVFHLVRAHSRVLAGARSGLVRHKPRVSGPGGHAPRQEHRQIGARGPQTPLGGARRDPRAHRLR